MQLSIVDQNGFVTDELKEHTERRLLFALSRFESRIQRISVVFADLNGRRGGIDKSCCITVVLDREADVVITDRDADAMACIARAAARAGRTVRRVVERMQSRDRFGSLLSREG